MKRKKRDYEILFWTIAIVIGLIGFGIFIYVTLGGLNG